MGRSHRQPAWGVQVLVSGWRRASLSLHLPQAALERLAGNGEHCLILLGGDRGQKVGQGSREPDFERAVGQRPLGRS